MAEFKDMLKYFRERENLSQKELAEKLGISASTISMYEVGSRQPNFEIEEAIADYFNVDLNTLRGKTITEQDPQRVNRALELMSKIENASPDVRSAILTLLGEHKSDL